MSVVFTSEPHGWGEKLRQRVRRRRRRGRRRGRPKWLSALPIPPKIKPLWVWGDYWKFILEHYFF